MCKNQRIDLRSFDSYRIKIRKLKVSIYGSKLNLGVICNIFVILVDSPLIQVILCDTEATLIDRVGLLWHWFLWYVENRAIN